jgi:hypothetical protein
VNTRRRITLATAGLCVALAGCGSAAGSKPPAKGRGANNAAPGVLTAYTRTAAAKTAKVAMVDSLSSPGETITISGSGAMAFDDKMADLTLSVPQAGTFAIRVISPEVYIEVPAPLRSKLPGDKQWLSLNANTVARSKLGASLSQLSRSSGMPTQTLAYLQGVSTHGVTEVGRTTIRGTATTQYKVTVNLTKMVAHKSAQAQAAVKKLELVLHRSTLPVQVWMDAEGRARQVRVQVPVPSPSGSSTSPTTGGTVTATIDFYDFGTPVHVTAPPAGDVYDATGKVVKG